MTSSPPLVSYALPEPWRSRVRVLIVYSVVMLFLEIDGMRTLHSREGHPFFLWSERIVASLFTAEYFYRWSKSSPWWKYPYSLMALVDLMAILPFWLGFFITDDAWLHSIRTLRILRLTKLWRHNDTLTAIWSECLKSKELLKAVLLLLLPVVAMGAAGMHELESAAQPQKFGTLADCLWFVMITVATVGYGDSFPVTAGGRLMALVLVVAGVCVYAAFVGVIGGAFLAVRKKE